EAPHALRVVRQTVALSRNRLDLDGLTNRDGGLSTRGERCTRVLVLVDDARLRRNGDDTGRVHEGRSLRREDIFSVDHEGDSGLRLNQSTRDASLEQVLLLVVVDVEEVEEVDLSAAVGTHVVVVQ